MAEAEQEAARTLITLEQTPEPIAQNQLPTHSGPRPRLLRPTSEPDHSDEPDQSDEPNQRVADAGTQDLTSDTDNTPIRLKPFAQPETEHKTGLRKGVSEDNIKTGKRARRPAAFTLDQVHLDTNTDLGEAYHSAFTTGTTLKPDRIHSRDLPKVPKTYKELSHHLFGSGFK